MQNNKSSQKIILPVKIFIIVSIILQTISIPTLCKSYAQESNNAVGYGMVINKIKEEYIISPGGQVKDFFEIIHDFDTPNYSFIVYPKVEDVDMDEVTGAPIFLNDEIIKSRDISIKEWITFEKDSFFLEKRGDKKQIHFTITIPKETPSGSYYGAIILSEEDPKIIKEENVIGIQGRISMLVVITVKGDKLYSQTNIEKIEIRDIFGNIGGFLGLNIFFHHPIYIDIYIKNSGNVYAVPGGDIFIYNKSVNNSVLSSELNKSRSGILNDKTRKYSIVWDDVFFQMNLDLDGNIYPKFNLDKSEKIYLGQYNATAKMITQNRLNGEIQIDELTVSFIVLPYPIIIIIIVLITIILLNMKMKINKKHKTTK